MGEEQTTKPWYAFVFGMGSRETYHIILSSITVICETKN